MSMRISGLRTDIDFWANHFSDCPIVKLDGAEVRVTEADTELGYVIVELRDEAGKLRLAEMRADNGEVLDVRIAEKKMFGRVEIAGPAIVR